MSYPLEELASAVGKALTATGQMLATAESCTGGGIAYAITDIAGSSEWFDRGFVTYSNDAKQQMLGVTAGTLQDFGAVSEQTAREMADGALGRSLAELSVAVTGIAGPGGGVPGKPVGTVCFAWALRGLVTESETCCFSGDRQSIRRQTVIHALQGVLSRLPSK